MNSRELVLLCRIYNELFDFEKQREAAVRLWAKDSDSVHAMQWLENAYLNLLGKSVSAEEILDFVEQSLAQGKGNRRALLILKARVLLLQEDVVDAERRVSVADLLVEASAEPLPKASPSHIASSPELLLDYDPIFLRYFSGPEREALKIRIKNSKEMRERKRSPTEER